MPKKFGPLEALLDQIGAEVSNKVQECRQMLAMQAMQRENVLQSTVQQMLASAAPTIIPTQMAAQRQVSEQAELAEELSALPCDAQLELAVLLQRHLQTWQMQDRLQAQEPSQEAGSMEIELLSGVTNRLALQLRWLCGQQQLQQQQQQ